ncbi:MAG: response regulator [Planctomycetes bacterium]|nr:response regulator [Planctomycetota bacterium]
MKAGLLARVLPSLHHRILALVMVSVVLVTVVLTALQLVTTQRALSRNLAEKQQLLAHHLADNLAVPLAERNYPRVVELIDSAVATGDLSSATVVDQRGRVVASSEPELTGRSFAEVAPPAAGLVCASIPGQGLVGITSRAAATHALLGTILVGAVLASAVVILALLPIVHRLSRGLTRPLDQAVHAARRMARGQFAVVELRSPIREIDALNTSLSEAARQLGEGHGLLIQARDQLHAQVAFQQRLIDTIPVPVFHCDGAGLLQGCNDSFTRLVGGGAAAGRPVWEMLPAELWERFVAAHAAGGVFTCETGLPAGNGMQFAIFTAAPLPAGAGHIGVIFDITARKEAEGALARARDEAIENSRLKSSFLATVSHEIRTPMNGIIGLSELLLESGVDAMQRECVEGVLTSGQELLRVINDLLDFSKMEAGRFRLDLTDIDLAQVVRDAMTVLSPAAKSKALPLRVVIDPELPRLLRADGGRIRQVLLNLVGNSLKFTDQGSVEVRVAATAAGQGRVTVRCEVQDTGIGIAEADLGKLFRPFVQVDGSYSRRHGGTGMGLSIVKNLVELMGGTIGVVSTPGSGSTFWFELPLRRSEAATMLIAALRDVTPRANPTVDLTPTALPLVLLAEDDLVNRTLAVARLVRLGLRASCAADGRQAVTRFAEERPMLVLMDVHMPELDGIAAMREIRAGLPAGAICPPIVALTANAMVGDQERFLQLGFDDYLAKPYTQVQFGKLIRKWVPEAHPVVGAG